MGDAFQQNVIKTLVDEISSLTGGRFEQFGYEVMNALEPDHQWARRGTTIEGAPRGYTVDTSSKGAKLVAEMSSEVGYFDTGLAKPRRDLRHILDLHPQVEHAWLLSSREAGASGTTAKENLIAEFMVSTPSLTIEILDARAIAERIYDHLVSERVVHRLGPYLPSLGRLADEHAFSHHVPTYPGYRPRPIDERAVIDALASQPFVVVAGMSGIGKSALAAHVANVLRPQFELVVWHDGHDLKDTRQLTDLDVRRTGARHNVASLLRRYRCLLILDDANLPQGQLRSIAYGASKVIVTCQVAAEAGAITLGGLDPEAGRAILEADVKDPCPVGLLERVRLAVGGHPLLLRALNRVALQEGWDGVAACCDDAVDALEDDRNEKVCRRILARHADDLRSELEFVRWCDQPRVDAELLAVCVSRQAAKNLSRRGFLAATAPGDVRLHDIVERSVRAVVDVSPAREQLFRNRLESLIHDDPELGSPIVRRVARLHAALFLRLLQTDERPAFIYGAALARAPETTPEVFAGAIAAARDLASAHNWAGRELEIRAIIESVEASYTLRSARDGVAAARAALETEIEALELLSESRAAGGELLRDLQHHHAKMLERLGRLPEAESKFRAVLDADPAFTAARLQLARILEKSNRSAECLAECRRILARHAEDEASVPPAVLLETLRLLAAVGSREDLAVQEPVILRSIALARELDREHAVRLIASVASKTQYTLPGLALRLFESIEWRDPVLHTDPERFDWAQAHKAAAKAAGERDARFREFLDASDEAYASMGSPNSFHITHHAEALLLLGRAADANARLEQVPEHGRNPFWCQRKAQALRSLGNCQLALEVIDRALQLLAPKDAKFRPSFLRDRAIIRRALADPNAAEDLRTAIADPLVDPKFRAQLEMELAAMN